MALNKPKETKYGVKVSYWRVDMLTINKQRKEGSIILNGYVDSQAQEFIESKIVSLNGLVDRETNERDTALFDKYFKDDSQAYDNIYQACYMCAKEADEFFKDAEDC